MPIPRGRKGVKIEMQKFKAGQLHSGSKKGPIVKSRKQAIAISLSEAGLGRKKQHGNRRIQSEGSRYNFRDHLGD